MSAHLPRLNQLRHRYKELVEARKFEEAVEVFTEVGKVYAKMLKDKEPLPEHFLDPEDDLL